MNVAAEERNAKLSSLLLLSPGKEYWADRLAAKGPRDSGSPQSLTRSKAKKSTLGWGGEGVSSSPPARGQNDAPSYTDRGQQHQEGANGGPTSAGSPRKKDFRSFTAVKKVAPLSPVGGGGTSPSAWSTQAFTSPGGGGGAERRGRLDLSSWRARTPGQGLSPPRQGPPSSSPRSLAKGDWRRGPAGVRPGQAGASRSLSPLSGGTAACFGKTSSVREPRCKLFDETDGLEQATMAPPLCDGKPEEAADEASGDGGFTAGDGGGAAAAAVVQPESCGAEKEEASADADDGRANGKAERGALFAEWEEASGEGRAEGYASDGTAGLLTVETKDFGETSGCTAVVNNPAGVEHDDPLRPTLVVTSSPSPLRAQLQSPITQDPSPCTSDSLHFAVSDGIPPDGGPGGDAAGQLPPSPQATAAAVREDSRPPLHGNGGGFTGHVPPGVRIVGRTAAGEQPGAASGGGSDGGGGALAGEAPAGRRDRAALSSSPSSVCSEGGGTGPPRGGEVKLFVSTPTGEGDSSDLSLWVTTRGSGEGGGEGTATTGDGTASPLPSPPSVRLSPVAVKSLEDDDPGIDPGDGASTAANLEEEDLEKDLRNGLGFGAKNAIEARSGDGEAGASGEEENEVEVLPEGEATCCLLQPSEGPEAAEEGGGDNEDPEPAVSQGEVENAAEGPSRADVPLLDSSKTIPSTTAETAANVEKTEVGGMEGPWEAVARVFCGIFNFCRPPRR
ncbi:unnamed protein product [Ectocarpus sp. CCAP 1310/34]|nr:unnamed protein product [Ectocarpus sp. CCAP 1310/34]